MARDTKVDGSKPLPELRQESYANLYIQLGNQTESYIRAYNTDNRKSAAELASKLMRDVNVRARIDYLRGQLTNKYRITTEDLIRRALDIADRATDPDADPKRYTGRDAVQSLQLIAQLTGAYDAHRREIQSRQVAALEDKVEVERERNAALGRAQQVIVQLPGVARPGITDGSLVAAAPDEYRVTDDCGQDCGQSASDANTTQ